MSEHGRGRKPVQVEPLVTTWAVALTISDSANSPAANSGPAGLSWWSQFRHCATNSAPPNVSFMMFSSFVPSYLKWTGSRGVCGDMVVQVLEDGRGKSVSDLRFLCPILLVRTS